jgi:hypothetical protein
MWPSVWPGVAGGHHDVETENLFGLDAGAGDGDVEIGLEDRQALDVVAVVMGDEHVGEGPAAVVERNLDGGGVGCIDRRGLAGLDVMHEIAVIVGPAQKHIDQNGQFLQLHAIQPGTPSSLSAPPKPCPSTSNA